MAAVDDAQADAEAGDGPVIVPLLDREVEVLPAGKWRSSGLAALHAGNFHVWARTCLTPEGWEIWQDVDPELDEIQVFFRAHRELTGEDTGKSRASRRSSRSTSRR